MADNIQVELNEQLVEIVLYWIIIIIVLVYCIKQGQGRQRSPRFFIYLSIFPAKILILYLHEIQ